MTSRRITTVATENREFWEIEGCVLKILNVTFESCESRNACDMREASIVARREFPFLKSNCAYTFVNCPKPSSMIERLTNLNTTCFWPISLATNCKQKNRMWHRLYYLSVKLIKRKTCVWSPPVSVFDMVFKFRLNVVWSMDLVIPRSDMYICISLI